MIPFLQILDLWVGYGDEAIIKGVSFDVFLGTIIALIGRNGAGKSTLMKGIAGIIKTKHGTVKLQEKIITNMDPGVLIPYGLSYVAQGRECFPELTVNENLEIALLCLDIPKKMYHSRINEAFQIFPYLSKVATHPVYKLSGGLQQMLVLAMSLIQKPKCILLDEPSLGLSQSALKNIKNVLRTFISIGGCVILIEQKPKVVFEISDYIYYLEHGKISMSGKTITFRTKPEFLNKYISIKD